MAINCIRSLEYGVSVVDMTADAVYSNEINRFSGAFYRFNLDTSETIYFVIDIQPQDTKPIDVTFNLYAKQGETFVPMGQSTIDEFSASMQYDASPASYYICITSPNPVSIRLQAKFTDNKVVLFDGFTAYSGMRLENVEFAYNLQECNSTIFYTMIDGNLPEGLEFSTAGYISGIPQEQDCSSGGVKMDTPSFTWSDEKVSIDGKKQKVPVGKKYFFTVRAALVEDPSVYKDKTFFLEIMNNWDLDRDHFKAQVWEKPTKVPAEQQKPVVVEGDSQPPITQINDDLCDSPEKPVPVAATDDEIREILKQAQIEPEFQHLVAISEDGLCEIQCEKTEPEIESGGLIELSPICPTPKPVVVVEGLQVIPQSLCQIDVESPTPLLRVPKYVEGIPKNCFVEILEMMKTQKVCGGRPVCEYQTEEPIVSDDEFTLKSNCKPCE